MLTIAPDAPTVWWFSLDDPATRARADAVAPLPDEAAAFAHRRDAGERALRRRLARLLLGTAGSCQPGAVTITRNDDGAPVVVAPPGWHLSVAARWPDALIGVARAPLGVDLERITRDEPPTDVLSATEAKWLENLHPTQRAAAFAAGWAAKEAHAKWTGRPRALDPAGIETGKPGIVRSTFGTTSCWRRMRGPLAAAICVAA